jgi:hypothetical protein
LQEKIAELLLEIENNPDAYRSSATQCEIYLKDQKKDILRLIEHGASAKAIYNKFITEYVIQNVSYNSFYKWLKR